MAMIFAGGLWRCCIETAESILNPIEGQVYDCAYEEQGNGNLIFEHGAFRWNQFGVSSKEVAMEPTRTLVVGRHSGELPERTVVGTFNAMYPADSNGVGEVLIKIFEKALELDAEEVAFQATPNQLTAALLELSAHGMFPLPLAFVVNKPSAREAGVSRTFDILDVTSSIAFQDAIKFVNPNAKIEVNGSMITVTVDPQMKFDLDHVEVLDI